MENSTPFDLNQAIRQWRGDLENAPSVGAEDLEELEAHLRESMLALEHTGLSAEERFLVACKRLGTASRLEAEFGKVNAERVWLHRMVWMVAGFVGINLIAWLASIACHAMIYAGSMLTMRGHLLGCLAVVVFLAVLAGACGLLWFYARRSLSLDRLERSVTRHPVRWVLAANLANLILASASAGVVFITARTAQPDGIAMTWRALAYTAATFLCWPSLLVWLLLRLSRTGGMEPSAARA